MAGMFVGRPGHTDSLSGLLRLIKDPESIEAHLKKIKEAEASHQESLKKAQETIAAERTRLDEARKAHEAAVSDLEKREALLNSNIAAHEASTSAFAEQKKAFEAFELKTSAELSRQEEALKQKQEALAKHQQELAVTEKRLQGLAAQKNALDAREKDFDGRETALHEAEQMMAAKAAKVRELIG